MLITVNQSSTGVTIRCSLKIFDVRAARHLIRKSRTTIDQARLQHRKQRIRIMQGQETVKFQQSKHTHSSTHTRQYRLCSQMMLCAHFQLLILDAANTQTHTPVFILKVVFWSTQWWSPQFCASFFPSVWLVFNAWCLDTCVLKNGHAKWPLNMIHTIKCCVEWQSQPNICSPTKQHGVDELFVWNWNWTSFDKELLSNKTYTKGTLTTQSNSPIASHQLRTNHFYVLIH